MATVSLFRIPFSKRENSLKQLEELEQQFDQEKNSFEKYFLAIQCAQQANCLSNTYKGVQKAFLEGVALDWIDVSESLLASSHATNPLETLDQQIANIICKSIQLKQQRTSFSSIFEEYKKSAQYAAQNSLDSTELKLEVAYAIQIAHQYSTYSQDKLYFARKGVGIVNRIRPKTIIQGSRKNYFRTYFFNYINFAPKFSDRPLASNVGVLIEYALKDAA